jgi:hypothetical protein
MNPCMRGVSRPFPCEPCLLLAAGGFALGDKVWFILLILTSFILFMLLLAIQISSYTSPICSHISLVSHISFTYSVETPCDNGYTGG